MKKSWVGMLLAAAISLVVAVPVVAATPYLDVSQDKGSSAWADVGSCIQDEATGDETCEYTSVNLFDGRSRYNGERFAGKTLCVSFSTSTWVAATKTYNDSFTSGCLNDANIVIAKDLLSASGVGTVATESGTCTWNEVTQEGSCTDPVPGPDIAVDLEWTGTGPVFHSTNRGRDAYGDCTNTYFSKGSGTDATVTGTLDGAPAPFEYAAIGTGKGRFTYACH